MKKLFLLPAFLFIFAATFQITSAPFPGPYPCGWYACPGCGCCSCGCC